MNEECAILRRKRFDRSLEKLGIPMCKDQVSDFHLFIILFHACNLHSLVRPFKGRQVLGRKKSTEPSRLLALEHNKYSPEICDGAQTSEGAQQFAKLIFLS